MERVVKGLKGITEEWGKGGRDKVQGGIMSVTSQALKIMSVKIHRKNSQRKVRKKTKAKKFKVKIFVYVELFAYLKKRASKVV